MPRGDHLLHTRKCGEGASTKITTAQAGMSALGQKQTLELLRLMSALPPKADIETQSQNVRFVPKADIHGRFCRQRLAPTNCAIFRAVFSRERASDQVPRRIRQQ